MLTSCYSTEKRYYGQSKVNQIKLIKKSKDTTFLSYKLPKSKHKNIRQYLKNKITYNFKSKNFKSNKTTFATTTRSTMNYSVLERIEGNDALMIDSSFVRGSNENSFIYVTLDPVIKGKYKLRTWGCRHGKAIEIEIK